MAKKEPTVGDGLAALLGVQASPEPKVQASSPESVPSPESELRAQILANKAETAEIERFRDALATFKEPQQDPALLQEACRSAQEVLNAARQLSKDAEANLKRRQNEVEELKARIKALDNLTETQRNQEYLASQKKQREDSAKEQQARYESLRQAGLLRSQRQPGEIAVQLNRVCTRVGRYLEPEPRQELEQPTADPVDASHHLGTRRTAREQRTAVGRRLGFVQRHLVTRLAFTGTDLGTELQRVVRVGLIYDRVVAR